MSNLKSLAWNRLENMKKWIEIADDMPEGEYYPSSQSSFLVHMPYNTELISSVLTRLYAMGWVQQLKATNYNEYGILLHTDQKDYDAVGLQLGDNQEISLTIFFEINHPDSNVTKKPVYYQGIMPQTEMSFKYYETVYPT